MTDRPRRPERPQFSRGAPEHIHTAVRRAVDEVWDKRKAPTEQRLKLEVQPDGQGGVYVALTNPSSIERLD